MDHPVASVLASHDDFQNEPPVIEGSDSLKTSNLVNPILPGAPYALAVFASNG